MKSTESKVVMAVLFMAVLQSFCGNAYSQNVAKKKTVTPSWNIFTE